MPPISGLNNLSALSTPGLGTMQPIWGPIVLVVTLLGLGASGCDESEPDTPDYPDGFQYDIPEELTTPPNDTTQEKFFNCFDVRDKSLDLIIEGSNGCSLLRVAPESVVTDANQTTFTAIATWNSAPSMCLEQSGQLCQGLTALQLQARSSGNSLDALGTGEDFGPHGATVGLSVYVTGSFEQEVSDISQCNLSLKLQGMESTVNGLVPVNDVVALSSYSESVGLCRASVGDMGFFDNESIALFEPVEVSISAAQIQSGLAVQSSNVPEISVIFENNLFDGSEVTP